MKVLFVASYFPKPDNPQMGTWALMQAQALARQNIDLLVISFTSAVPDFLAMTSGAKAYANCPQEYTWSGGVRVLYPRWLYYPIFPVKTWAYSNPEPYLRAAWWSAQKKLCYLIEQFQPDIIFCHHSLPNGWMLTRIPPHLKKPLITFDHDFDEIADCQILPKRKAAMAKVAEQAWAMLAVSRRMENDIKRLFSKIRTYTHSIGVDPLPEEFLIRQRPIDLVGKKVILSCALFAKRKGIPLLIEAFCRIAPKHPDAVLRIIGSGPEQMNIESAIALFDKTQQVQLLGKKLHEQVLQEMVWADCFALVGWDEPLGAVYLEAMAAGKPIICCQDGGINDMIEDGVHGYTVPPKDIGATAEKLDCMLNSEPQRVTMGKIAQQLVQRELTWDAKAVELLNLFNKAITNT